MVDVLQPEVQFSSASMYDEHELWLLLAKKGPGENGNTLPQEWDLQWENEG
jgi:hypothetical protein